MKNIKIRSVANEYGIIDGKDIKSCLEVHGLDREKLLAEMKRVDLSQKLLIKTSVGNITVNINYDINDIAIIASSKIREQFAKE